MENILFYSYIALLYLLIGAIAIHLLTLLFQPIYKNWWARILILSCLITWPLLIPAFVVLVIWLAVKEVFTS